MDGYNQVYYRKVFIKFVYKMIQKTFAFAFDIIVQQKEKTLAYSS